MDKGMSEIIKKGVLQRRTGEMRNAEKTLLNNSII